MPDISKDRDELRSAQRRTRRERDRERKNWRAYDATEFGQFDEAALALMIQEGRPPTSFNIIKRYVDSIAGSTIADGYDINYETELGDDNVGAIIMKELYLQDKGLSNLEGEYLEAIRAGFIYRGWVEMFVDKDRDPRGRVGFRYLSPDRVVGDPDWTTHRVKDNKQIFILAWMSPQQIKDRYHASDTEITQAISQYEQLRGDGGGVSSGVNSSTGEIDKLYDTSPDFFDERNGLFLVASKCWLKKETKKLLFDLETQQFLPDMPKEDIEHFLLAAQMTGKKIDVIPSEVTVCKVRTFAPAWLNVELQAGNHPIQRNGYPFFCFSSDCINGRPNTPTDQLYDVQTSINKREATITHVLMTTGHNALSVEEDATSDPEDAKKIATGIHRPGAGFLVAPGANNENKIKYLTKNQPPTDLMQHSQSLLNIAEKITPAVPALQGLGESGDSGVLFQAKLQQAQVGIQIPSKFLKTFWNDVGDAFFYAAQQTYTYPMILSSSKDGTQFRLNMEGGIWIESIPRLRTVVTQSPTSDSFRRSLLQQLGSLEQYITGPLTKQSLGRLLIQGLPGIPDEEKNALSESSKLEEELAKTTTTYQLLQAQTQLKTLQDSGGQPPPQPTPADLIKVSLALKGEDLMNPQLNGVIMQMLENSNAMPPPAPPPNPAAGPAGQGTGTPTPSQPMPGQPPPGNAPQSMPANAPAAAF